VLVNAVLPIVSSIIGGGLVLAGQFFVKRAEGTTHASSSPALLLGFALPSESELIAATRLLAEAVC
jgi:hypothetical protein